MWKCASNEMIKKLQNRLEEIWETDKIPEEFNCTLIHTQYKKGIRKMSVTTEESHCCLKHSKPWPRHVWIVWKKLIVNSQAGYR